jgi:hypothetical protein
MDEVRVIVGGTAVVSEVPAKAISTCSARYSPTARTANAFCLSKATLATVFHLPIAEAAQHFNVCMTLFKYMCRRQGIKSWPQRRVAAILRLNSDLQQRLLEVKAQGGEPLVAFYDNILGNSKVLLKQSKAAVRAARTQTSKANKRAREQVPSSATPSVALKRKKAQDAEGGLRLAGEGHRHLLLADVSQQDEITQQACRIMHQQHQQMPPRFHGQLPLPLWPQQQPQQQQQQQQQQQEQQQQQQQQQHFDVISATIARLKHERELMNAAAAQLQHQRELITAAAAHSWQQAHLLRYAYLSVPHLNSI